MQVGQCLEIRCMSEAGCCSGPARLAPTARVVLRQVMAHRRVLSATSARAQFRIDGPTCCDPGVWQLHTVGSTGQQAHTQLHHARRHKEMACIALGSGKGHHPAQQQGIIWP